MVSRHMPTICLIFIGIRVPGLVDIGYEVDIWWTIRIFCYLVLIKFVDVDDGLYDPLGFTRSYQKIINTNQNIFPVYLPCG